ncbi:MAG TPA: sulfatase-like hydrolase/transferase [Phycisphaerae bacterium]|nr:sulfatase-like hydrolase/transferase [Phycisphaerae bacterium]HNU46777.1 sulfatase-like hydrolase/transferase [Phycisphaerae bacterium]
MQKQKAMLTMGLSLLFSIEAVAQLPAARHPDPPPPNILVIVADDVGVDTLSVYNEGYEKVCDALWLPNQTECQSSADCPWGQTCVPNYPPTPTIDSLAANGILFRNAWSCPTCSPTRATIQTGRYGFRTGVFFASAAALPELFGENELPGWEVTIPEALALAGSPYATAAIGKWHLGGGNTGPNDQGYSHFAGTMEFFDCFTNYNSSYYCWPRILNGVEETCYNYATTQNVDDAVAWIDDQTGPWLLYLAFNAAHMPYHAPPDGLHSYHGGEYPDLPWTPDRPPLYSHNCIFSREGTRDFRYCYLADVEAMDSEIGRLRAWLEEQQQLANTTIIFVGDNGTSGWPIFNVTAPPFNPWHAKATMFEGGINVPLIISGARVQHPHRESPALVNTTDLFATVLNLAGVDPNAVITDRAIDSVSLMPIIEDSTSGSLRDYVYSESYFEFVDLVRKYEHAMRNAAGYKLIHRPGLLPNRYALFYLVDDPFEQNDLYYDQQPNLTPVQQGNFDALKAQMESLVTSVSPPDGESCQPTSGTLEWPLDLQAVGYRVQIGTECGTGAEVEVTESHCSYSGLQRDTSYFWRVRPKYPLGIYGPYSRCYSFSTAPDPLPPPTLLIPVEGATHQRPWGTLDWSDVPGALGYRVQIGTSCGAGPESAVTGSQYAYSALVPGVTYYWRVQTKDLCDHYGDWSGCSHFATAVGPVINCEELSAHYFGWVAVGQYGCEYTWQITNFGDQTLNVTVEFSPPGCSEFVFTHGAGSYALTPGQSRTVGVQFHPSSSGRKECALHITSNDPVMSPCDVPITGDGGTDPKPWGGGCDGDVVISADRTLTRDMEYRNLTVLPGRRLNTHGYTVRVLELLDNSGTITDDYTGGAGGAGGAGGKGANPKGYPSDLTGCGRVYQNCTNGGNGGLGHAPAIYQGVFVGYGGDGGGGGGGGGGGWHNISVDDADGGNGAAGGAGGKGGGYVKVYAHDLNNRTGTNISINANGYAGSAGATAPEGDEGDPNKYPGYEQCGAENFRSWGFREVSGGGGGGGAGGNGGNGGTVVVRYARLINQGSITAHGGAGGSGGGGGTYGGPCRWRALSGGCSDGCPGGTSSTGGHGGHGCYSGGDSGCGSPGQNGGAGLSGSVGIEAVPDLLRIIDCGAAPDCDDGFYCNGEEQCVAGLCVAGAAPNCDDGLECTDDWCSDASGACRHDVKPGRCLVGGSCHEAGTVNPANDCEACNPLLSTSAWSPRPAGVHCGDWDSSPCDHPDTCDGAGGCLPNHLADGLPCDDGLFCNGTETCVSGYCQPGEPLIPGIGDIDGDGHADLEDFATLRGLLSGPGLLPTVPVPACLEWYLIAFDLDADGDVDLADFAVFQRVFTGAR